ncbi:MAG: tetratricopeptide repeat protein [Treponema sp.]|nr:tetratricopeptide repeat protein [Treponema sp.]
MNIFTKAAALLLILLVCVSCASTKKGAAASKTYGEEQGGTSINIAVPKKNSRTYFSRIDAAIMEQAENGSPEAIRAAVARIRKPELNYSENEKVLLTLLADVMKIAWPSERAEWDTPAVTEETPYLGAIDSVRKGIYDFSTGNVDFFTLVLPSLVVINDNDVSRYVATAEQALLAGILLRPQSTLANYLLGLLYQKANRAEEALACFVRAVQSSPSTLETSFAHASCLKALGRMSEAFTIADALHSRYPNNIRVLKLCAETSFALNNFSAAEEYVARVLQQTPNDLEYVLFRARILAEKGDFIRAVSLLDVYSRQDTTSRDYLLLRAHIQSDWSKNVSAAVATIENALARYPNDLEVLLFAAKLASITGSPVGGKTAGEYAQAVLAADPENNEARRYEIAGMMQSGNWTSAYAVSSALMQKSDSRNDIFTHIRICLETRHNDEAWNLISPLYAENPADEDVVQSYILVLSRIGRTSQALALINSLLGSATQRMKSFLYYRRSFLVTTQEESLADLRSSLIANPRNSDALFRLYEIYYGRKDYRRAQYYLRQVVALDPNNGAMRRLNDELSELIK